MAVHGFALAIIFLTTLEAHAQPSLGYFRATRQDDAVLLEWQIVAGNLCNGITIQRAVNQEQFARIGSIDGICGSISEAMIYSYLDTNPGMNGSIRYRLELGSWTYSEELAIDIVKLEDRAYVIKPSPVTGAASLHFANPLGQAAAISVYSLNGLLVHSTTTRDDRFTFDAHMLAPGIYVFAITDGTRTLHGRFLVAR